MIKVQYQCASRTAKTKNNESALPINEEIDSFQALNLIKRYEQRIRNV